MEEPNPVQEPKPAQDPAPIHDPDPVVTPLDPERKIEEGITVNET